MKRQIYKYLIEWKNNKEHKPLILLGARQVGKGKQAIINSLDK